MTTKRIDELPAATALTGDDLFVIMNGAATTQKITAANARDYLSPPASETVAGLVELATTIEAAAGTDTGRAVTPAGVAAALAALVDAAPGTLDTLNELAAALGDDPNFATTIAAALAGKQPLDSDLTAIAALTTTSFGRGLLELADAAALRSAAWIGAASDTASGIVELATTAEVVTGTDTDRAVTPAGFAAGLAKQPEFMIIAVGDETTAITTGTAKVTWRMPFAFTITAVRASLATASSSGNPAIDINEGGASIFSTTLTIDANELTSTTAATACVISDASIADDALMTIDIDTAGTGAKGLKVCIYGTRA